MQFIASASGFDNVGTLSTLDCTSPLNIQAGDIIVAWNFYANSPSRTPSIACTDASNALTMTTQNTTGANRYGSFGYILSAAANAAATFRQTLSGTATFRGIMVFQFRPTSGSTLSLDVGGASASGISSAAASANFSTTGTEEIVIGGGSDGTYTWSSPQIGGVAADGSILPGTLGGAWYKILSSILSSKNASATISNASAHWLCDSISIKSVSPHYPFPSFNPSY